MSRFYATGVSHESANLAVKTKMNKLLKNLNKPSTQCGKNSVTLSTCILPPPTKKYYHTETLFFLLYTSFSSRSNNHILFINVTYVIYKAKLIWFQQVDC